MVLETALGWYQGRISLYDKQSWETTVEQRILQGLSYTPRKTAKPKTEFIDVDLVRGSTFPKAKPHSGLWLAGLHGITRIIFLPLYFRWWIHETSCAGFFGVLSIYCSILYCGAVMITYRHDEGITKDVPVSEMLLPAIVLVVLSVIHSQIVCTRHTGMSSPSHTSRSLGVRSNRRMRPLRRSASLSGRGKCVLCSSCKRDTSRHHSHFTKKHINSVKNKSPFKTFRSHSEEPRCEETFPIRPRSASENNASPPMDSAGRPKIIIFQSFNDPVEKQNDRSSSSATTSSSDRSPVIGNNEANRSFLEQFKGEKIPELNCASNSESEEITMILNSTKFSDDDRLIEDSKNCQNIDKESLSSIKIPEGKNNLIQNCGIQSIRSSVEHLKLPEHRRHDNDGGSDGGEESGMGDLEIPTTDTDSWNIKRGVRRPLCPCMKGELSDTSVPHPSCRSPHKLPHMAAQRSSCNSSCESDAEQSPSSQYSKTKHSEFEWTGITSNTDDLSYSSESEGGWDDNEVSNQTFLCSEALDWNIQGSPAAIITSTSNMSVKVSCKIWEGVEVKKVDLSVLDISSAVISKVDSLQHTTHYLQFGLTMATLIALVPSIYRVDFCALDVLLDTVVTNGSQQWVQALGDTTEKIFLGLLGSNGWVSTVIFLSCVYRFALAAGFFFLLAVAERTFKQRFLYAKHFCYLTSARRARKYDLPHFRLNKVHNIKTWLSVRSCLKKRGPQRSVDVIVSATFIITLLLVSYLCFELLKEDEKTQQSLYTCELFFWCFAIGIYLIRFMTLGAMINKKYSSLSVLITEQINMYLHMEQKPQKKDELILANNVLKLVSVLLKELESPFKISGLSANPLLYNITRLVVLSACSGVLSDLLGFKLKLHKIKFKE
ncbi:protein PHTF2-like isoform X2 [Homarus americanus]|nr:protein PHTF2-like isoform X2 [Homarus americanus]XP_042229128.1 protein PHTF2-like isoform X2 [Homarus americanus]